MTWRTSEDRPPADRHLRFFGLLHAERRLVRVGGVAAGILGEELEVAGAQLVATLDSVADAAGRLVRVAWVVLGVVEVGGERQDRAFRQADGAGVSILVLPVEVPVGDPEQRADRAIGKRRGQAE